MLSKAHLTSHSRISGSRSETTPSLSFGSLKPFCIVILYIHATSSLSLLILLGPYHFCPLLLPSWHGMFHWYLEFSWCDLYSFQFYCFPLFLCIVYLKRSSYFLSLLAILWNSAFSWIYHSLAPLLFNSLLSSVICKASSDNHFAFLHFFFFGMVLATASSTMLLTSVLSSSGTLSTRSNPLNLLINSTV